MKPNLSLATLILAAALSSCTTPIAASITDPAAPLPAIQAASPTKDAATIDTLRARRIEIVDATGRPRITIGDRGLGAESLQFLNREGEVVWSASYHETGKGAEGDAFVVHGEAGTPGGIYNLVVSGDGCALYLCGDDDPDEGAIGIQYSNGEAILSLAAKKSAEDIAGNAQVKMALVKHRIVIRDMSGRELISFAAPMHEEEKK